MKSRFTTDDILDSIEFELAQGTISRDDLGTGLSAVKEFQNKSRTELFGSNQTAANSRTMINRQFQINDMHLTLLQEIAAGLHGLQLDLRRMRDLIQRRAATSQSVVEAVQPAAIGGEEQSVYRASLSLDSGMASIEPEKLPTEAIEDTFKPDALRIKLDIRYSTVPIVRSLIWRVRSAIHNLVLYYVNQLAQRQASINQVYGERLLRLGWLIEAQQQQLDSLAAQVEALQSHSVSTDSQPK
jgi:hypothetical protein